MKSNKVVVFLLFPSLFTLCIAALENTKKRGDITQKSNSNEETEEEVAVEDMENAFEQLRELSALRDKILKLVPASDPIYDKISKQVNQKDDAEGKTETTDKENLLENPGTRNVWMKTMIAQTKDIDPSTINARQLEDEDIESWEELYDILDEVQEPLSPEQQTGKFLYCFLIMFIHCYNITIFFSGAVV